MDEGTCPHQVLPATLTLSRPWGADYAHPILVSTLSFESHRRACSIIIRFRNFHFLIWGWAKLANNTVISWFFHFKKLQRMYFLILTKETWNETELWQLTEWRGQHASAGWTQFYLGSWTLPPSQLISTFRPSAISSSLSTSQLLHIAKQSFKKTWTSNFCLKVNLIFNERVFRSCWTRSRMVTKNPEERESSNRTFQL